jgi:hypothetical protein
MTDDEAGGTDLSMRTKAESHYDSDIGDPTGNATAMLDSVEDQCNWKCDSLALKHGTVRLYIRV